MISPSIEATGFAGLFRVKRSNFSDARGLFSKLYTPEDFKACGFGGEFQQVNYARTVGRGTVRGMHFQDPPYAETKIVTCLHGEVLDVAVDLRANSKTFLQWHGEHLSSQQINSVILPAGMAHGFQVLSDEAHLIYFHSKPYIPQSEGGLNPLDPRLNIGWPLEVRNLSRRDQEAALLGVDYAGLDLSAN